MTLTGDLPAHAQVVIIGGGIVGASVAYHLAERGWHDVVVCERRRLAGGATAYSPGLVGQLWPSRTLTRLARYSADLYARLGEEAGFRPVGSVAIATSHQWLEALQRSAAMARCLGITANVLSREQAAELWPLMRASDVLGAVHLPADGTIDPVTTTQALARGSGAGVFEGTQVTAIRSRHGRVAGVVTGAGDIEAEYVVNCAGMWSHEIGRLCGVGMAVHAAEHACLVTEPITGLGGDLPVLCDPEGPSWFRQNGGKLLLDWFEPNGKPFRAEGFPEPFGFDRLPDGLDHFRPLLDAAAGRVPRLAETAVRLFFGSRGNFTPDDRCLLGEAPELRNLFVAAGFDTIGTQSAGGAGKVLADWIVDGLPSMDVWDLDLRRMMPFRRNAHYLRDRTAESLGRTGAARLPHRSSQTTPGPRRSVLHDRLAARGACFEESAGWERPGCFSASGERGAQNAQQNVAAEHQAVRRAVGLFDLTSQAKFLMQGPDAEVVLDRMSANRMQVPVGRIVSTQFLNRRGGIEADVLATRTGEDSFLVAAAHCCQARVLGWIRRSIPSEARTWVTDATSAYAVLGLMGPRARALLARLTPADLSNEAFPHSTSQEIELAYAWVRANRCSPVGELGWELWVPAEFAAGVFDALLSEGAEFGLCLAGSDALQSLCMEKGQRQWGRDMSDEDTPFEAGLAHCVALDKADFVGREALLRSRGGPPRRRLVHLVLEDTEATLQGQEPIWCNGTIVGWTTSAMFGHSFGRPLAMGYVSAESGVTPAFIRGGRFEVEIACRRVRATVSLRPFYDPLGNRVRM